MDDIDKHLQELLKKPRFQAAWEDTAAEYEMIGALIRARNEMGLTQNDLSTRTGIDQSVLSRIENGNANPSLKTLDRLARGLGKRLVVEFR